MNTAGTIGIDIEAKTSQSRPMIRWVIPAVLVVVIVAGGWWFLGRDPLRTVPELPVREYLDGPEPFVGQIVKAELAVSSELSNSPEKGRLMAFSDARSGLQIVALVPPALDNQIFSKNQKYLLKLRIGKGGLAHVEYLKKL